MDYDRILTEARNAAYTAAKDLPDEGACGFGWATVSGNDPFARYCRKLAKETGDGRYGRKGYPTGWTFWNPGNYRGQSVDAIEAGARAFRDVLGTYGIRADVCSRLD
jgi:hypothetical protein